MVIAAASAAARSVFRSSTVRSAATRLASQAKSARSSPFRLPSNSPLLAPRILRSPAELSACLESMQPYHTATASALMTSMLTVSRCGFGWLPDGRHKNEETGTSIVKINVNEEYKEAFRTKSYTYICNKVQGQLETRLILDKGHQSLSSSCSSSSTMASQPSSPRAEQVHLLEYLVEPCQETLTFLSERSKKHQFIVKYFNISQETSRIYEFILQNINQARVNYHAIKNVIKLIEHSPNYTSWNEIQYNFLLKSFTSFSSHSNPFSKMTPEKLQELHDSHVEFFHRLTSQCRKTRRRRKVMRCIKRALFAVGCGAFVIAYVVLIVIHNMIGVVAAPAGLILCSLVIIFLVKKWKKGKQNSKEKQSEGLEEQLDLTKRVVYTLLKNFDTLSSSVKILQDEMEHKKSIVEICVIRNGKNETLKKIAMVLQTREACFQEELEDLEKHIYLSFLNINRLRRLLLQELDKCL